MNIPFSPPYIDEEVIKEVTDSLNSGWITTGPKVKALEELSAQVSGVSHASCVNSWTSGAMLVLKWLGIGEGDEVIVPAYTYSATALAVLHRGATPVMVDVLDDFTIDPQAVKVAITPKTKAIFAVDIAGWPCDYDALNEVLNDDAVKAMFVAANDVQAQLGRPALLADAAHSLGATYNNKPAALFADITIYSLHAVKNVTTAEGGVICMNLPAPFDNGEVYKWMRLNSLNGQTKDAFTKSQGGSWRYDIITDGMKINMPDVCAAIGLAQLRKYKDELLPARRRVFDHYVDFFGKRDWAVTPPSVDDKRNSSYHLYPLRINNVSEEQRDAIIQKLAETGVAANVHFVPMPMLTLFKNLGYSIDNYPQAYKNYACEISLPIYPQLTDEQLTYIEEQLEKAYNEVTA